MNVKRRVTVHSVQPYAPTIPATHIIITGRCGCQWSTGVPRRGDPTFCLVIERLIDRHERFCVQPVKTLVVPMKEN